MTKKEKKKEIKKNLSKYGLYNLPVDIIKLAISNGFKVFRSPMNPDTTGILIVNKTKKIKPFDANKIIIVNAELNYERSRFIVAHEFSHFIMENNAGKLQIAHRDYSRANQPKEIEADEFACMWLMPDELVLRSIFDNEDYCENKVKTIYHISETCRVTSSKAALLVSNFINEGVLKFDENELLDKEHLKEKLISLEE